MPINKHYALVHNSDDPKRDGVERRLEALENMFKSFYLIFAIKGKALPAPTEKLVAILTDNVDTFNKQRNAFHVTDLVSDGYYARQENLAIFSPNRIDNASRNFEQIMRDVYRKNGTDLLTGKFPDLGAKKAEAQYKGMEVARAQSMAMVEQALREESEIATATHEGTLQLLSETGVLPRTVNAPEWLRFGLASIFEMPKGPFPGKSPSLVKIAFHSGAGGPNPAYLGYLWEMMYVDKAISPTPHKEFLDTISDAYFDRAHEMAKVAKQLKEARESKEMAQDPNAPKAPNKNPPGPARGPGPNQEKSDGPTEADARAAMAQARTMSWAVTYYLFMQRFDEFDHFLAELSKLPRNAEIDRYSLFYAWGTSFDKKFAGLSPTSPMPKADEFSVLAKNDWLAYMQKLVNLRTALKLQLPDVPMNPNGQPGAPGNPNNPNKPGL